MGKKDPRVDAYIEKSAEFAKPILKHIRKLVHSACPEVEEAIKWQFPTFNYKGLLCSMAAFKAHCTFGFWKYKLLFPNDPGCGERDGMGQFGKMMSLADLPKESVLLRYIKEAVRLNDEGIKLPPKPKAKPKELVIPDYFSTAIKRNKKATATFEGFSYSHKKEYVQWITEAKREETRQQRLDTAVAWLAEGKARNWKYMNC
jgi:uncharacterized protein YdeI (YjbR/CyaY-like superfamily)